MVFSSIPAAYYNNLHPSNWQQQQNHQIVVVGSTTTSPLVLPPPQPEPPPHGTIRPGSMAERARMANIPVPESALKCPRCDSVNTKFCYFNNYSLSQPRHFCKTCRRYWTRGGALRSVPVGGGCRRTKRSKPASSKSPAGGARDRPQTSSSSTTSNNIFSSNSGPVPLLPSQRFASPMNQIAGNFTTHHHMGLNYTTIPASTADSTDHDMNFQLGSIFGGGGVAAASLSSGIQPWRVQQYPSFLGGFEPETMCQFQGNETGHLARPRLSSSMKTEENLELKGQLTDDQGTMPRIKDNQWNGSTSSTWSTHELSNFRFSTSN